MKFPINLDQYKPVLFSLDQDSITEEQKELLNKNINLIRDSIVFMTALSNAKGIGGHTGGAYDIVPEALIIDGFIKGDNNIYPVLFDDAGHRVAIQYILAAIDGHIPIEKLLRYREYDSGLPGHPELDITPGINFSSGRLGHIWSYLNGLAIANPGKKIVLFSSDGAQQEGNSAEAARFAADHKINIKLIIDDNDVTIAGHPSQYMPEFDIEKTLIGHGIPSNTGDGEDIESLFNRIRDALLNDGPQALINKRKMSTGIEGDEGTSKGHDAIALKSAAAYLNNKNHPEAVEMLQNQQKITNSYQYKGSSKEKSACRKTFGTAVCSILEKMGSEERKKRVLAIDSDLSGSCGLSEINDKFPEIYIQSGIMERGNFSAAAGFGSEHKRQGIFGTFAAFLEMIISEISMSRLNNANVLAHFSHSGVDDMSDNTCHFGINNFFADNALMELDTTRLYFPADPLQMDAIVKTVFDDPGLRFIFSTRSSVPFIHKEDGSNYFDPQSYAFDPKKDEIIRKGKDGYIVSYGEMLYRCLDAVELLKEKGLSIGLINKPSLNIVDEQMLSMLKDSPLVVVMEGQNEKNSLGVRFGTWLMERGSIAKYAHYGLVRSGNCGQSEQMMYQDLEPSGIIKNIISVLKKR
ncbi:MAG: transketolase [Spirochaetes bacterium]|nr:transketolase [Spirochaetota bacterium]